MTAVDESNSDVMLLVDETYEFSAPRFYDFLSGESEEDKHEAELWFDSALSCAPSPFMPKIRRSRPSNIENLCDFNEVEKLQKTSESLITKFSDDIETKAEPEPEPTENKEEPTTCVPKEKQNQTLLSVVSTQNGAFEDDNVKNTCPEEDGRVSARSTSPNEKIQVQNYAVTPKPTMSLHKGDLLKNSKKHQTAKKIAGLVKNPSALKPKSRQSQLSQAKSTKPSSVKRDMNVKNTVGITNLAQENQAIKRQKLEGGGSRQILNVKPHNFLHKSKLGLSSSSANSCSSVAKTTNKEDRKMYVREPAAPFVSMAEMMKKFQSSTRDLSLSHVNRSLSHDGDLKPKLALTRPKEPELETSQRVRLVKIKSTAELEEEMMAKIPKFKARPLNKKILEAPTLPPIPRSTPQLPEFQEFHLETAARANNNAESASVASIELSHQSNQSKAHLTEPKTPFLHTSMRARPPRVKSSFELEQEELEKIPKFKARPLNKKILESKGEIGLFCKTKKHVTEPEEFHFATNERIPPPAAVVDLFDKLSLNSGRFHDNTIIRNTKPIPFHLRTEERGAEKERQIFMELVQKQLEEERARIPRATPYPYTTDFPVMPPKPEPKQWTKPEPFQLESLVRHEEEMQRELEERRRMEKEEAKMRIFKAQPVLKEDPIPIPQKVRKPLTQVQEFNHHVDDRAVDRAEFDLKIKEKEMMYKRYRDESEVSRMVEEEKALKQLRRTMVPHARPVPKFDHPFCPQKSSKETTKAKSPHLRVLQRKERRKEILQAATSSAASRMR